MRGKVLAVSLLAILAAAGATSAQERRATQSPRVDRARRRPLPTTAEEDPQRAEEEALAAAEPSGHSRCGVFMKWVGLSFASEDKLGLAVPQSAIEVTPIEFWKGPFVATADVATWAGAQAAAVRATTQGSWGDIHVDGNHNTAWLHEFFAPQRIVRTRWEFDCLNP